MQVPGEPPMPDTARDPRPENEAPTEHLFKTTITPEKFEAVVARSCRYPVKIEIHGGDPTVVPQPRVFAVYFTSIEDRERVRIAMRFVEKEQAEVVKERRSVPRPAARIAL